MLNNFKNYDKISLETGVKISTIKKASRKMMKDEPMRIPRKLKDSVASFTIDE